MFVHFSILIFVRFTINVRLGNTLRFLCHVIDNEAMGDRYENLIFTQNQEQVDRCNVAMEMAKMVGSCVINGVVIVVEVSDSLQTGSNPRFEAGEVYYFTSECMYC